MDISQLNFVAILFAAISRFAIGGLWYGPVFGSAWMTETGITEEKARESNMAMVFGLTFIASLVSALCLGLFIQLQSVSVLSGVLSGFVVGFAWVAMSLATNDLFEQRSLKLFSINAGYHIVAFIVMGAIIGVWP